MTPAAPGAGASSPVAARLVTDELLTDVADAVALTEGVAGVRLVLRELTRREPVSVRDLSRAAALPLPIVAAICNELRSRGVVSETRPVQLTDAARGQLGRTAGPDVGVCPTCAGVGRVVPDDLWPIVERQRATEAASPMVRVELDQAHCTPETAVRRALLLADEGALDGGRVLLLGDDDLVSVAIMLVVQHLGLGGPAELVALDVDDDLVAFLKATVGSALPFQARTHDLRDPLPPELRGHFDVVMTDPPYTAAGARLFGSRAADALVPGPGGDLYFSFGSTRPDVVASAQADLLAMGFAIRSLVPDFNEYLGTGALAGSSALSHVRATGPLKPLVVGRHDGDLYTSDGRHRARRYTCRSCGRQHLVGPGEVAETIAALQAAGCECGAIAFEPGERVPDQVC
jgi:predicted methyltransferase